jgi:poly-beta-1,6-N-acetyl-D-glucosamine synthase
MLHLITAFIIGVAVVNLVRMMVYLVGADFYTIRRARSKDRALSYRPSVSLVVPAHNEGPIIERTLACLLRVDYDPLQIIMADDGSTDDTLARIHAWKKTYDLNDVIQVFTQPNGGKADALNNAIAAMATGELVMCLDGDSIIAPDAVEKSVAHFRDPRVVATASNVNIMPNGTLLGLVQRYEYLISYHMKKAQNLFNVEYIIGGIGSMFRRDVLDEVGLYDTNTMTEDIDLTLKIIAQKGNTKQRVAYAHDAITYTEAVPSFRSLIRQRYRWKYGRLQAFYKNYRLFFSRERKHSVGLSWFFLPYALWQEIMYLIEPLIVTVVLGVAIYYRSPWTLISAMVVISGYVIANILSTVHLSRRDKALLSLMAPTMYVFLYLLSVVEYIALIQTIVKLPRLRKSISGEQVTWTSPERAGALKGGRHRAGAQA